MAILEPNTRAGRKRGEWHTLPLKVGDIIAKETGTRGYKIESVSSSWLQVRNIQTQRRDAWDQWQSVKVLSWGHQDRCTEHDTYYTWCDNCLDSTRNQVDKQQCDHGHYLGSDRNTCEMCPPCTRHNYHSMTCSECAIVASKAIKKSPALPTTTDKDNMNFSISVAKVLGGHVGQINFQIQGQESTVVWQSEPQQGTTEVDGAKMTAESRARFMAEEELSARIGNMFS